MPASRVPLLAIAAALVLVPWLLWRLRGVRRAAPLAVVQIMVGVALGPSLLGRAAPEFHAAVFTPEVLAALQGVANVGAMLYVLVAGMHLDPQALRGQARRLAAPALGSFLLPFGLGMGLGVWMAEAVPGAVGPRGDGLGFAAAIGACVACTALPVLAAILREAEWTGTRLGQVSLALAALNDAALWLVLAVVLALSAGRGAGALSTLALALAWGGALVWLVRPLLARLEAAGAGRDDGGRMLVAAVAAALASGAAAEAIGIGYIVGGFAAGTVMPRGSRAALLARLEPAAAIVLLPFFFMATGLKALIEPDSAAFLAVFAAATAATVAGKVAGAALPARAAGERWSFALALGALLQAKGLMEVVVLAVLLDAGLIGRTAFSALVAMAIVCTLAAAPLARLALAWRGGTQAAAGTGATAAAPRAGG
ncbi:sodium/hydrogen exchanger [Caldovatus sediminis]|uniref:Sodium/hydrogen exchanger n=1 Tax=Caldovatus sediminis TaxID=2041189 RepID=A0A8J3EC10_9PROT|nr:cation:proton antiporter [Caldovatus sediminis]GGG31377.1 sodium/hydrogen exchanger [Caldovatus sediminis]